MIRKKKILHVCYEYPPIGGGGGDACKNIVEQLDLQDFEQAVLTTFYRGLSRHEIINNYQIFRIKSIRRNMNKCSIFEMGCFILFGIIPIVKILRKWKPDVIHAHFAVPSGVLAFVGAVLFQRPYILTFQGGDVPSFVPGETSMIYSKVFPFINYICKHAARRIAVSEGLARMAEGDFPGTKFECILNGVDLSLKTRPENRTKTGPIIKFLYAGRLADQKNPIFLIEALARVAHLPGWSLEIVGEGPLKHEVERRLIKYNLQSKVSLKGWLAKEELFKLMLERDVLLLPSKIEGLPTIGVQALAHGMIVIGSNTIGIADIVQHEKNGFLFTTGNLEEFAELLQSVILNSHKIDSMRSNAIQSVDKFDWKTISSKYSELYQDVISKVS